jgi:hypothetical protein
MSLVTIDYYEADDSVHVFVAGYAINKADATVHAAVAIAKAAGQAEVPITTYCKAGPPQRTAITV